MVETEHFSVRLPNRLLAEIRAIAAARARPASSVVTALIDEGLRARQCPGVFFADAPSGRRAGVAGSRLAVWEIVQLWRALQQDRAALAEQLPHLAAWQLDAAIRYHHLYPEEIDRAIEDNARMGPALPEAGDLGPGPTR